MLVNKFYSTLSFTSQKTLYNSLFFYNLSYFSNFKKLEIKNNIFSFRQFLVKSLSLTEFHTNSLIWAQLICINNSFLYLDVGGKITLVKPKLKRFLETSIYNEILLIWDKPFFKFMLISVMKNLIKEVFQYNFIKLKSFLLYVNEFFSLGNLCFKKLSVYNKYLKRFIIVELKRDFFSIFQKKISFFQLNILFRKLYKTLK